MSRKGKGKRLGGLPAKSPSLESTSSQTTAPAPRFGHRGSLESGAPISAYGSYLFDCVALVICCQKHNRYALTQIGKGKSNWLPFVALKSAEGWYSAACNRLKQLLTLSNNSYIQFSAPEMIHIFRLHLPSIARFVNRITFLTYVNADEKNVNDCCKPLKSGITWVSVSELMGNRVADLWGPEPVVFVDAVSSGTMEKGAYTEYTLRDAMKYAPREPPKTYQDEMLKSAQFTEKDVQKLYAEFIQHAFPSQYMSAYSFANYMSKIGWKQGDLDLPSTFRAFGFNNFAYLTFHEFLLGIAALDKHTNHGGHPGELRCGYIFRYYDSNNDGTLDKNEMFKMTLDILRFKNRPHDQAAIEAEMTKNMQAINKTANDSVKQDELLKGVGTMAFRGSSALFRASIPVLQNINTKRCYDSLSMVSSSSDMGSGRKPRGTCPRCRTKKY
ncbi:Calcineurin-like protein phosphoesterase, partial [Leptotrombidium deliense]